MKIISACTINFLILSLLISTISLANNLSVTTPTLVDQDNTNNFTYVQFDVSWDNSWRVSSSAPFNYDAVWVFVKYKIEGQSEWKHATLSTTNSDHSVTTNNGVTPAFNTASTGIGTFIQRAADGSGSIDWDVVKIRWNYGLDIVPDEVNVTVKVFAVEMVYIPGGSFYVGDGTTTNIVGQLHNANSTTTPFNITSEGSIALGGTTEGDLGNNNAFGMSTVDDFNNSTTQTLPAAFPKGWAAFYIMKYEISQVQYVDFLNCLTRTQQDTRTETDISGTSVINRYVMSNSITVTRRNGIRCDAVLVNMIDPIEFYNDYNNNGIINEVDDGQHIACNYLIWNDGAAYADWAGLRPFTELEYEKVCRGTLTPIANEYAWGNTFIHSSSYEPLSNPGREDESASTPSSGPSGNCAYSIYATSGPFRVGIFAGALTDRVVSGASYFGAMEMSGSLWEGLVTIGSIKGRSFIGSNGDGILSLFGNANNSDWPGFNGFDVNGQSGSGFRGGSFIYSGKRARISDRFSASQTANNRDRVDGMRLARTSN